MKQPVGQMLAKAKRHHQKGESNAALEIYNSILEKFPKNARAREGIAALSVAPKPKGQTQPTQEQINGLVALFQHGQLNDLLHQSSALIRQFPKTFILYSLQGAAHSGLGRVDDAITSFRNSIALKPNFADGHTNLGKMLLDKGNVDAAIECFQRSLSIKPNIPETISNLGNALQERGDFSGAIEYYHQAIKLRPHYAEAYINMGLAQRRIGHVSEAIDSYETALRIQPNNPETHLSLGVLLKENHNLEGAISCYEKALNLSPDFTDALNNLGLAMADRGDIEAAIEYFTRALDINSNLAESYLNYSRMVSFTPENQYLPKMREMMDGVKLSNQDRMFLGYALSKAENDIGNFEASFKCLSSANAIHKHNSEYDIVNDAKLFHSIRSHFESNIKSYKPLTHDTNEPQMIFVLGMPRSGSTLVEQIVSSHSSVFGSGERGIAELAMTDSGWQNQDDVTPAIVALRSLFLNNLADLSDAPVIVDKTLQNVKWIGFLMNAFPEAKFVHVTRNAAAVCWSNLKTYFPASGMDFSSDQEDTARYFNQYDGLMKFWYSKFPGRICDVNYEELTENQETESRRLLQFLDLAWENQVLDFHKNRRDVSTASNIQIRQKMYQGSSKDWNNYESWLQPMLKVLRTQP